MSTESGSKRKSGDGDAKVVVVKPAARSWTPRAGHVKESVLAFFAPGSEALKLLVSVLRPSVADTTNTTSIRTVLWFVSSYAAFHHIAYTLKGSSIPVTAVHAVQQQQTAENTLPAGADDSTGGVVVEEEEVVANASSSSCKRAALPLQPSGSARASIPIGRGGLRPPFVVATQYQNARDSIGDKLLFDPNCRVSYNLEIPDGQGGTLATSIGQLNFFKWAIQKEVLQYVIEHRAAIAADQSAREVRGGSAKAALHNATYKAGTGGGAARKRRRKKDVSSAQMLRPMRVLVAA